MSGLVSKVSTEKIQGNPKENPSVQYIQEKTPKQNIFYTPNTGVQKSVWKVVL